jgi:hypothetical protein
VDKPFEIQKSAPDYLKNYLSPQRMTSIAFQYQLAIESNKHNFLEVGPGNNLLSFLLRKSGKNVQGIDIDIDISPDVLGVIPNLPFRDQCFEVSLCFQVLEHLPFTYFIPSLLELARVSSQFVIISLPHRTINKISPLRKLGNFFYHITGRGYRWKIEEVKRNQEHFWEIGLDKPIDEINEAFKIANLTLSTEFRNPFLDYHHFFILHKENLNK